MTASSWLAVSLLACAAVVAGWPAYRGRARRRLIMGGARRSSRSSPVSAASAATGRTARGPGRLRAAALRPRVTASPRLATLMTAGLAAFLGAATGGPVAAVAAGAYGGLAMRAVLRRQLARKAGGERVRQLDGLCALAADLRAGLPVPTAASAVGGIGPAAGASAAPPDAPPEAPPDRLAALAWAAFRLAEQTGAPLADLVERVEADARAMDRALAGASAQAAGARATAWLLAGLPLGGIALGYGIGVDPLAVLLHTPVGAGCAVGAIVLQFAGLAWADRLSGSAARVT